MLVGAAVGLVLGIAATLVIDTPIRPDVVVGLVVGVPGILGLLAILTSARRWMTTAAAFLLAIAPGWFGALVAVQAVHGA